MGNNLAVKEKDFDYRSKLINEIKNDKKMVYDPKDIGEKILEFLSKDKGMEYSYVTKKQVFMRYKDGVWREENVKKDGCFLRKIISNFLYDISPSFNRRSKVNEVIRNIIIEKSDSEKGTNVFNPANQTKHLINFKNFIVDIKNQKKIVHGSKYNLIYQSPVNFSDKAKCPLWKKSLKQWIDDEETRMFLQEFTGYLLSTYTSGHRFVIFFGEGANGKSVFLNIIQALLGESYHNMGLKRFVKNTRWTAHALEGKLANVCSDIDPVKINSSELIKKIAVGDSIDAEIKNGPTYNYKPVIKLLFSANKLPKSKDTTYGFYRRLEIVKFPNRFTPGTEGYDPQLTEKLKKELPGIAKWAIQGLIRFLEQGQEFTISKSMKSSKLKYMGKNEVIKLFINGNVDETDKKEDYIINNKLHKLYSDWVEDYGITPESLNALTRYIEKEDIGLNEDGTTVKPINGESKRCYIGMKLKKQNERFSFKELFSAENINEFGFLE